MARKAKYMQDHILEGKFKVIDKRFDAVDESFTALKQDANRTEERFNQQEKLLRQIDSKFDLILDITGRHESSVSYHGARLGDHEKRIVNLERRVS